MGCDIHAVTVEKLNDTTYWVHPFEEDNRNYRVFAALAGVRNGFGVAGVATHTPLEPISEPRGLPRDLPIIDGDEIVTSFVNTDVEQRSDKPTTWLGDHSHSWLTLLEILDYDWDVELTSTGVISMEQYEAWDGVSMPSSYSGGISGPNIVVDTPDNISHHTTHVQVKWNETLRSRCEVFLAYINYLAVRYDPETTRIVFGFDS